MSCARIILLLAVRKGERLVATEAKLNIVMR
jgi:hypothetical protein